MDELVLGDIARQVVSVDEIFVNARIGMIEKATQWDEELYMNWRRHLLAKKVKEKKLLARVHGDRRDEYIKWRYSFSEKKYAKPESFPRNMSHNSLHSSASSNSLYSDHTDDEIPPSPNLRPVLHGERMRSQSLGTTSLPPPSSSLFRPLTPNLKINTSSHSSSSSLSIPSPSSRPTTPTTPTSKQDLLEYAFSGMHHIFAETTHPITCIEFGNNDNDILAFGSQEGHIYICSAFKSPRLQHTLKGHRFAVTSLKWLNNNDLLLSTSMDSIRIWERKTGLPVKMLKETGVTSCLHPVNSAIYLVSDNKGYIKVYNVSTGKSIHRVKALASILCMQFDTLGQYLFAGDEKGNIEIFKYTKENGNFQLLTKTAIGKPVVSLSFKSVYINQQFSPSIIVNCRDNTIKMFTMKNTPNPGTLVFVKEFFVQNKKDIIRSKWCPSADSSCFVTGSENSGIYFFDVKKKDKAVNSLMGHGTSATNVSWSFDESLMASGDLGGMVILWSRKK
jgi:WD40 repeat protein